MFNKSKKTFSEDVIVVYFIKGYYYISKQDSEALEYNLMILVYAFNGDMYVRLNNVGRIHEVEVTY